MSEVVTCRFCSDWPVGPDDRFCGGCGAFVAPVAFTWRMGPSAGPLSMTVSAPEDWAPSDRADLDRLAVVIEDAAGNSLERDLTLGEMLAQDVVPLPDVSRLNRIGQLSSLVVRVTQASSGDGVPEPSPHPVAALALASAPAALTLPTPEDASLLLSGRPWAALRLRNLGGDVVLTAARLVLDEEWTGPGGARRLMHPVLLRAGAEAAVDLPLPEEVVARVLSAGGVHEADLEFLDGEGATLAGPRVLLSSPARPAAELELMQGAAALAGRFARIAARLSNVGGGDLRVGECTLTIRRPDGVERETALSVPPDWTAPITRESSVDVELRPWMTEDGTSESLPLPPGLHMLTLTARLETDADTSITVSRQVELTVREPKPFVGRLCVDFGTTESAVAVVPGRLEDVGASDAVPAPLILELGRVGLSDRPRDAGDRFLPTEAVISGDGRLFFGDEAVDRRSRDVVTDILVRGFKWELSEHEGLAAGYLAHLRQLTECHPRVAALISEDTPVAATRPTDFGEGAEEALVRAFRSAGFGDPRRTSFSKEGVETLSYESWSPMILALWGDDANLASGLERGLETNSEFVLPHAFDEPAQVVIYDVGGGSADLSALKVSPDGDGGLIVREVHKLTDRAFVGVEFEKLIQRVLCEHVEAQGLAPDRSEAAARDWRLAVEAIQHDPGLFTAEGVAGYARDHLQDRLRDQPPSRSFAEAVREQWGLPRPGEPATVDEGAVRRVREVMPHLRRLKLPVKDGKPLRVRLEQLPDLLERVLHVFADRYVLAIRTVTEQLIERSGLGGIDERLRRLIPSGRGGAFPLARALILALFEERMRQGAVVMLTPQAAKSITSYGGLHLADLADLGGEVKFDLGRDERRFSVVIGRRTRGPDKGARRRSLQPAGPGAAIRLDALPPDVLTRPLRLEATWGGSTSHDVVPVEYTATGLGPEAQWLAAWRSGTGDRARVVPAENAEEAVSKAMEIDA